MLSRWKYFTNRRTASSMTSWRSIVLILPLRAVLRLLHGDLVDVRKSFRSAGAFDGFHRDVLHLLLGIRELFFECGDLRLLPGHRLFQRFDLHGRQTLLGFGVLLQHQDLLLEPGFSLLAGLLGRGLRFFLQTGWKSFRLFLPAGARLLARLAQ